MRVPLKISAKCMKSHNCTKYNLVSVILISILGFVGFLFIEDIIFMLVFIFSVFRIIKKTGKSISGSSEKIVKENAMLDEIFAHFPGDGKNNVTMFGFKSHGRNKSRTLFSFLGATLGTEMGMTGMSNQGFFGTSRTLEKITAKIDGMTKNSFLDIVKADMAKFFNIIKMREIIIVIKEDIGKGSSLFRTIMMREVKKRQSINRNSKINHNNTTCQYYSRRKGDNHL